MLPYEWDECVQKLQDEWPMHKAKFTTARWQNRFGHLEKPVILRAIDVYADDNLTAPTVNALVACLPRGTHVGTHKPTHVHEWQSFAGALLCIYCGSHGPGCRCPMCLCGHHGAFDDGIHQSGHVWMRCKDCTGVWLDTSRVKAINATTHEDGSSYDPNTGEVFGDTPDEPDNDFPF